MSSKIPGRQLNTPSLVTSSVDDSLFYDRGLLDRSLTGSVVLRSSGSGPTPPKVRADGDVEKVKVYARIRPALREDETPGALVWSEDSGQLTIFRPEAPVPHSDFVFDKVLGPTSSQADVYNTAVTEVVADVLRGYNGTILAYGQTGAGKTYTLGNTAPDAIGMIPRAAAELFSAAARDPVHMYSITMSYIQIYMEMIQDLLNPTADNLPIREDANGVFVAGACEVPVSSLEECLHYLELGEQNRVFAFTHLNAHSSRSHAVVMLTAVKSRKYLTSEERAQAEAPDQDGVVTQRVTVGKLYMVDLAGSERLKKSKSVGLRATEARSINLSLTTLGMCISARAQDSPHVPFRDSKLTRLLQESLGGNAKTSLILCLSDVRQHADESLQSLQFGARAACVRNKPVVNERLQMRQLTAELLAALEENHERADGLEAALSQTKEERDMLQAALAREKAHTARIVDALRAEAKAKEEHVAKLAAQAELLSEHVQQLGQVQQQQGQLELEMEQLKREHKAREEAHQLEVAALQEQLAAVKAAAEEAAAAAAAEKEALKAEARSQQAQLAAAAQQQTTALATRLAQERVASRDQAASIHLALTRLQRALGELVSGPTYPSSYLPPDPSRPSQGGPEEAEAGEGTAAGAHLRRAPPPSEAGAPPPLPRPRVSSGGSSAGGGSGGGAAEGWGSGASSLRGRSEGSGRGSHGGGDGVMLPPAGGADSTVSRRAQWMANLAAAVASRRGMSTGSSGAGAAVASPMTGGAAVPPAPPGSIGGESSGGGSAVQLIKQALGMEAGAADADQDGLQQEGAARHRGEPSAAPVAAEGTAGGSAGGGGGFVGAVAHLKFDLPQGTAAVAAGDKPFISPPCSSPRSLGGATVDTVPVVLLPSAATTPSVAAATAKAARTSPPTAAELDLSDIDAALAAAQQDLLADFGGSVRAVQLVQSGAAVSPRGGAAAHLNHRGAGGADGEGPAGLTAAPGLGDDDPSAASLGPQSLTVSSSSGGGGGYGMYGDADAGSDDGAVDSYAAVGASAGAGLSTPFMQSTGRSAAASASGAPGSAAPPHRQDGGLILPPNLIPPAPQGDAVSSAAAGTSGGDGGSSTAVASLRLGSGTFNHNPAFDSGDLAEERLRDLRSGVSAGGAAAGLSTGARAFRRISGGSGGGAATAADAAAAAAPWLRDSPLAGLNNISGGGASDIISAPSHESSLNMLLPPPNTALPHQAAAASGGGGVSHGSAGGAAAGVTHGSALFAGIQVQLDSLLEMAGVLRRIKTGLEQRLEQQAMELVRRHEEQLRLEAELGSTGTALQASRSALAAAEAQLADTLSELLSVRGALDDTVVELGRTRTELEGRGQDLAATQQQLVEAETRLEEAAKRLEDTSRAVEAGKEEGKQLAQELEKARAELSSERATVRSLLAASARSKEVTTQALAARHELQRQVRAANAIKRAYKAFKVAQLRGQVAAKQRALQEAANVQREREAAQAARAGQALVQESVSVIKDAVGSILAAFVGRRNELEARRSLLERLDRMGPSSSLATTTTTATATTARGGAATTTSTAATAASPTSGTRRSGSSPIAGRAGGGGGASNAAATAQYGRAVTSAGLSMAPSTTPLRGRVGTNPVSLSMMLAAATMPMTAASPAASASATAATAAATAASPGAMSVTSRPTVTSRPRPAVSTPAAAAEASSASLPSPAGTVSSTAAAAVVQSRLEVTPREVAPAVGSQEADADGNSDAGSPEPQPTPAPTVVVPHTPAPQVLTAAAI